MSRVLLVIPPFTQLNTAYPSTAFLSGFLRAQGREVFQQDAGMETLLRLLTREGLAELFHEVRAWVGQQEAAGQSIPAPVLGYLERAQQYQDTIEPLVAFLQGRDLTLAHRICHGGFLPMGPRLERSELDEAAFGTLGKTDQARHLCTLVLDDLADLLTGTICPQFGLTRYAERLATAAASFDPLQALLDAPPGYVDRLLEAVVLARAQEVQPTLVGFSVPFPGNLYGALRAAQAIKRFNPAIATALGGGYVNTELRGLREPRLFDCIDFVTLDDGERPLLALLEHLEGRRPLEALVRTFTRQPGGVVYHSGPPGESGIVPQAMLGVPWMEGLPNDRYLSVLAQLNPMHRLWTDGRWNKLMLAHGCYWRKCSFCDISLDYIGRFEASPASLLVDRMEALLAQTGQTGFHFVDEAAPPLLLRDLALEILRRGLVVSWWGNIRFEKTFSPDLCRLLARAGCIAVSGGLEVASDRLLARMQKGVTVAQVARVAQAFTEAGVMVHAYLMYGFPTETEQETLDSLERVRQLFDAGVVHSAFWHRFVATRHAPIGLEPGRFGISVVTPTTPPFAENDLTHQDPEGADHDALGPGLERALAHYMEGRGLDRPVQSFFSHKVPRPKVSPTLIQDALGGEALDREAQEMRRSARLVWLGNPVTLEVRRTQGRSGKERVSTLLRVEGQSIPVAETHGPWWVERLRCVHLRRVQLRSEPGAPGHSSDPEGAGESPETLEHWLKLYPGGEGAGMQATPVWKALRDAGLVGV